MAAYKNPCFINCGLYKRLSVSHFFLCTLSQMLSQCIGGKRQPIPRVLVEISFFENIKLELLKFFHEFIKLSQTGKTEITYLNDSIHKTE